MTTATFPHPRFAPEPVPPARPARSGLLHGHIGRIVRLQFNVPSNSVIVPPFILGLVFVISAIIALTIQRATGASIHSQDYIDGARGNGGVLYALPGFFVYWGVQSVSTTFPFALGMGTTRRAFSLGTLATHALMALYVGVLGVVLLLVELATDHWFIGVYALDTWVLGSGDVWQAFVTLTLLSLAATTIGSAFGAVWVRFGNRGPIIVSLCAAVLLALGILLSVPAWPWVFTNFALWWLVVLAAVVIGICSAGQYLALRRASVR